MTSSRVFDALRDEVIIPDEFTVEEARAHTALINIDYNLLIAQHQLQVLKHFEEKLQLALTERNRVTIEQKIADATLYIFRWKCRISSLKRDKIHLIAAHPYVKTSN
jgi:hypothetical protein